MPDFVVTSPDGKKFKITAPEGATQQQILDYAQKQFAAPKSPASPVAAPPAASSPSPVGAQPQAPKSLPATSPEGQDQPGGMIYSDVPTAIAAGVVDTSAPKTGKFDISKLPKAVATEAKNIAKGVMDVFTGPGTAYKKGMTEDQMIGLAVNTALMIELGRGKFPKAVKVEGETVKLPDVSKPIVEGAKSAVPEPPDHIQAQQAASNVVKQMKLSPVQPPKAAAGAPPAGAQPPTPGAPRTPLPGTGGAAKADLRRELGIANRKTAVAQAEAEPFVKRFNQADQATQWDVTDYMEKRSTGAQLPANLQQFQAGADIMKKVYGDVETELRNLPPTAEMGFIQDYVAHLYKDPAKAQQFFTGQGKFGNSRFTKERSIPTLADARAAGLELATDNPLQAMMIYVEGANRYIAKQRFLYIGKQNGTIKYYSPGKQKAIPPGWQPLLETFKGNGKQAYAPADYAHVYNNFISRGIHGLSDGRYGKVFDWVMKAKNFNVATGLNLSGFHWANMVMSSLGDSLGRSLSRLEAGHPIKAAKEALMAPFSPVTNVLKGKKANDAYLGLGAQQGSMYARVADLMEKSNFNVSRRPLEFAASGSGSFYRAFKQGALKAQLKNDANTLMSSPAKQVLPLVAKQAGRVMDTLNEPLFEHYIPALRRGAFYKNMSSWLEDHPAATQAEQEAQARVISDSIDNRFGEMQWDNLFWNKAFRNMAQLALLAPGWDLGFVREIGGGGLDLSKPLTQGNIKAITTRTNYIFGWIAATAFTNMAYQYLMTGKVADGVQDLLAPQTGGKNPDGSPERAILPGHISNAVGFVESPFQEARNKVAPIWSMSYQALTASDWRGRSTNPTGTVSGYVGQALSTILQSYVPFSLQNAQRQSENPKSRINPAQSMVGIRPAPMALAQPEKLTVIQKAQVMKQLQSQIISDKIKLKQDPGNTALAKKIQQETQEYHTVGQQRAEANKAYRGTLNNP